MPSAVDQGDEVQFDGSATASTLIVPNAGYAWNFGDGTTATGPSVVHSYTKGGIYNVTLTVTDRGGNKDADSRRSSSSAPPGQNPTPPSTQPTGWRSPTLPPRRSRCACSSRRRA